MKGIVVTADNQMTVKDFEAPVYVNLGEEVNGDIELVRPRGLHSPFCMVVNENGLGEQLPLNKVGSYFYQTYIHGWPIVGTAVFLKEGMTENGADFVDLSEDDVKEITSIIEELFEILN